MPPLPAASALETVWIVGRCWRPEEASRAAVESVDFILVELCERLIEEFEIIIYIALDSREFKANKIQ